MEQLVKTMVDELKGFTMVLDVGVGTGRFARPLQESGFVVVGVDIAGKMLRKAMKKGTNNLLRGDACFLPFSENSFDASVCIHLLHLVSEWKMALQEICRATREVMLSTVYTTKNIVGEVYQHILEGHGYESKRPGKGEWQLKELVKPSKRVFATAYDNHVDEYLEHLSRRAYSCQWEIPESVNRKAVDELRRQFGGKVFPAELQVLVWDIDDLKDYCKATC